MFWNITIVSNDEKMVDFLIIFDKFIYMHIFKLDMSNNFCQDIFENLLYRMFVWSKML